ncbi:MAG: hypothetical protein HQL31_09870 [Planctomycetes bacterium]|nr:hypothetical protein [Planctomycetota bacterium]
MNQHDTELYRKMYLVRSAELAIQKHYLEDEMKTPMHMSMGEEAIVAGICHALKPEDQVLGSYRSHGIWPRPWRRIASWPRCTARRTVLPAARPVPCTCLPLNTA